VVSNKGKSSSGPFLSSPFSSLCGTTLQLPAFFHAVSFPSTLFVSLSFSGQILYHTETILGFLPSDFFFFRTILTQLFILGFPHF